MKKAIAIVVSMCLLVQSLVHLGVVGYYQWNKAYIAKYLCENKNKPELNCCGKCYLKKQLKKAGAQDNSGKQDPTKNERVEQVAYVIPAAINFTVAIPSSIDTVQNPTVSKMSIALFVHSFFHPPSLTV